MVNHPVKISHSGQHEPAKTLKRRRRVLGQKLAAFSWAAYGDRSRSLSLLRKTKKGADLMIESCDGFSERVHWQVVSALSARLMEQSEVLHVRDPLSGATCRVARLPDRVSATLAQLLIECAYGERQLSINESNLEEFLQLCSDYHIEAGARACLNYARKILNPTTCIYLFKLSLLHHNLKLKCAAYKMMRSQFKRVLQFNPDFQTLECQQLVGLLRDNSLALDDNEELAWLAILRWMTRKPLTRAYLTSLYNQMVSGQEDVVINFFQTNNATSRQVVAPNEVRPPRRHSAGSALRQPPLRISLSFYSPGYEPDERRHLVANCRLPTAAAAAAAAAVSPNNLNPLKKFAELRADWNSPGKMFELIKSLRYMRFKSAAAFDVIGSHPLVRCDAELTALVNTMRIKYKLRHKIKLTSEDKQSINARSMAKLKLEESSKTKRSMRKVSDLLKGHRNDEQIDGNDNNNNDNREPQNSEHRAAGQDSLKLEAKSIELAKELVEMRKRCAEPRVPSSVGFLFGGWQDGTISKTIWAYDFILDRWFKLNIKLPEARAFHASCAAPTSGHVYIFGGTDGKKILDSVWRFNPFCDVRQASDRWVRSKENPRTLGDRVTKKNNLLRRLLKRPSAVVAKGKRAMGVVYTFKRLCPMSEPRCHLAGVFHSDGRVYALGGHNGSQQLRSAEWYDTKSNQWHRTADMAIARSDAAACSHDNKIFVAGGQFSDQLIQSTVEFYKSSDDTWTFVAPMIIPRMSFSLVSYKSQLLALGGTNGLLGGDQAVSVTRSVERYNQAAGSWTFCAPMAQKRCSFGTLIIGNKLIAVGGYGGCRRLKKCETLRIGQISATAQESTGERRSSALAARHSPTELASTRAYRAANLAQAFHDHQDRMANTTQRSRSFSASNIPAQEADQLPLAIGLRMRDNEIRLQQVSLKSALKWVRRADLPERRSGFSLAMVPELRNARDYTYFGSTGWRRSEADKKFHKDPSPLIRQPSRWKKFKIIKRRKLAKYLKMALVVSIVILML